MADRRAIAVLVSSAVLATPAAAAAQVLGAGPMPRDGACFYQDTNYRGPYFCAEAGVELGSMPQGANDRVSSIRVLGRAEVVVFESQRFRGPSLRFDASVRDLEAEDFNDVISSIRIGGGSFGGGFRGSRLPFGSAGNPDVIVRRAYQDILEREPDPAGLRLYRSHIIDDGWTEQDVRETLRKSPEFREKNTMTPSKAQDIVRRAYLAILNREPDPGSQTYVTRVLRERWTQQDVERALRQSPEYRNGNR